jgi:hypothetical protein
MENTASKLVFLDKSTTQGKLIQVSIGIVIAYLVYLMATGIMKSDTFTKEEKTKPQKLEIDILDGYADSSSLSLMSFNTVLPYVPTYMPLNPSVNFKGGAQFTYSLWLNIANPDDISLLNKCIFMRGDKRNYEFNVKDNTTSEKRNVVDKFTYCPMLSFGSNKMDFVVRFNTSNKVDETLYASKLESDNAAYRKNILSILQANWIMVTIVFEDNIPINDFENGIRVQIYLNNLLYETRFFMGMLKQNIGNLYFFPDGPLNGVRIANMKYFNYALSTVDIKNLSSNIPTKAANNVMNGKSNRGPPDLSTGNILDIYNI